MHAGLVKGFDLVRTDFLAPGGINDSVGQSANIALERNRSSDYTTRAALEQTNKSWGVSWTRKQ